MEGWHAPPDFAEQAEALGLTTSHIVAVADAQVVTYTHDGFGEEPNDQLYAAVLLRDHESRILKVWRAEIPAGTLGEMQEVARARYGDPPDSPGD